jgi:hypothetical protein
MAALPQKSESSTTPPGKSSDVDGSTVTTLNHQDIIESLAVSPQESQEGGRPALSSLIREVPQQRSSATYSS